ncbi:fimbria/pilus periplasmic chaperone [Citrobacter farmeri]|uniref:fimbria/pilus periplasmic chaperone n=1 Tax=Citrobacter farmeri TaxID=67824 RepID=UPI001899BE4D|nr:fimbria/pilus periplasmic chaperone [Citrobacter farmeri]EHK0944926.1 fimbria/pilus periplasmic chaperone [Citrobacter farmeri]EKU0078183.1 fimbria/pilus periplasmic chaperone [Citrobacter farmeri]EKX4540929.1 fimbria/pilus periplasmic chaperone [Citrobacter farmeri]MBJ9133605.1 fimbria/pilus periplasmic chaperone [Citrobacter farmeri]MBJ9161596.1 fimbria/pilus periplasmic chaperone [Citrobacter farmeri]
MLKFLFASLLFSAAAQGGILIGGTRFVYDEGLNSITVDVKNHSDSVFLINTTILSGGTWSGAEALPKFPSAFAALPPLFSLQSQRENKIRLVQTNDKLPADRESLFTLQIAAIPSRQKGGSDTNNVQMATRFNLKLFYRPKGLAGDSTQAYRNLQWQRNGTGLAIINPSPYFVTIFKLQVNGKSISDAGLVPPFSKRQVDWCQPRSACQLQWQTIDDFGRILPTTHKEVLM